MPRYKLTVEYDGTGLIGWQRQKNGLSVQEILEQAAEPIAGGRSSITGAGRTDSGVHATGQVAHLDLPKPYPARNVMLALNNQLHEHRVAVVAAEAVPDAFHARFSATSRHYCYRILNRLAPSPQRANLVWHLRYPLDIEAMRKAAGYLIGHHDFSSFRSLDCQSKSPVKTLDELFVEVVKDEVHIITSARSFMHSQVRIMAGCLANVGRGRWEAEEVKRVLELRDRVQSGPTAPACGLTLERVVYGDETAR